jgi:hypothetical protein
MVDATANTPVEWDALVASSLARATSPASAKPWGRSPLHLRPSPSRQWLPAYERSLAGIHPAVRAELRGLVRGEAPWPLTLVGAAGRGKTCAALVLLDYCAGQTAYRTFPAFSRQFAEVLCGKAFSRGENGTSYPLTSQSFWLLASSPELLVLDEVGMREVVSDTAYESLWSLLECRRGRPLVLVSNLDLEALARVYDGRITSRLTMGTVLTIKGPDRRAEIGRGTEQLSDEAPVPSPRRIPVEARHG